MRLQAWLVLLLCLGGCADAAKDIPTQYVSPLTYENYNCKQIGGELERVSRRVGELATQMDKRASKDTTKMTIGLILFWPTLFFVDGNGPEAAEYGRLKGEHEALEKVSNQKECGFEFKELVPPEKDKPETQEQQPL